MTDATRLELLKNVPLDSWIALSEDESRIVTIGSSFAEVSRKSELTGVEDPIILKTPKAWLPLSV